jgi:hypothetical protein
MSVNVLAREDRIASLQAQAWRVSFWERTENSDSEKIIIKEPVNAVAALSPVNVEELLESNGSQSSETLDIIWIPPNAADHSNLERISEAWFNEGVDLQGCSPVRAGIRTVRVYWSNKRALIYAGVEQVRDALDAVVRFTLVERGMTALEMGISSIWSFIEQDASLTHAVTRGNQKQQQNVNQRTELATHMRVAQLRVSAALEQLDPTLTEPSKRLYAELMTASALYDRVERIEEPIQFGLDHYELANTRLTEDKYARAERTNASIGHVLESTIILLLMLELAALLYEIQLFHHSGLTS